MKDHLVLTVGVRELEQDASQVLARVEQGESFVVTVQGRTVVALTPGPDGTWIFAARTIAVYGVHTDPTFWDDVDSARGDSIQEDLGKGAATSEGHPGARS